MGTTGTVWPTPKATCEADKLMLLPWLWKVVVRRVETLRLSGREERALRLALRYSKLRPKDTFALINLSKLAGDLETEELRKEAGEPEAILRRGLERNPDSVELMVHLAMAIADPHGPFDEAWRILKDADVKHPKSYYPPVGMAWVAWVQDDPEKVVHFAEVARRRFTPEQDPDIARVLGAILLVIPEAREMGLELMTGAAKHGGADPWPHLMLAVAIEGEDPVRSREHLEKARKVWRGPDESFRAAEQDLRRTSLGHPVPRNQETHKSNGNGRSP